MTRLRPPPHGETSRQPPVEEGFVARPLMAAQLEWPGEAIDDFLVEELIELPLEIFADASAGAIEVLLGNAEPREVRP